MAKGARSPKWAKRLSDSPIILSGIGSTVTVEWFHPDSPPDGDKGIGGMVKNAGDGDHIHLRADYEGTQLMDYLYHEIAEYVMGGLGFCYSKEYPDREGIFLMDHTAFNTFCSITRQMYEEARAEFVKRRYV